GHRHLRSSATGQAGFGMPGTSVVGLQWGDEAKGKIVDMRGDGFDFVVRYNGGANAGHTVVANGRTFKLSLLPTGVIRPNVRSVIGNGVVVIPPRFLEEVESLRVGGIDVSESLGPSGHAGSLKPLDADAIADQYLGYAEQLRPYVTDTSRLLLDAFRDGKRVLFEAAQGSLLDVDHGTYPYVTSSSSLPSGIWGGAGVPAKNINRIIGVVKAYTTRVGKGPFPTELDDGPDGIGERI